MELLGHGERVIGRLKLATPKTKERVKAYVTAEKALETATAKAEVRAQMLRQATASYNARKQQAESSYMRASERRSLDAERDRIAQMQAEVRVLALQCQQLTTAFQKCRDASIRMVNEEGLQAVERQEALSRQREELSAKLPMVKRKFDEADMKSLNMPDATVRAQWLTRAAGVARSTCRVAAGAEHRGSGADSLLHAKPKQRNKKEELWDLFWTRLRRFRSIIEDNAFVPWKQRCRGSRGNRPTPRQQRRRTTAGSACSSWDRGCIPKPSTPSQPRPWRPCSTRLAGSSPHRRPCAIPDDSRVRRMAGRRSHR